MKKQKRIKNKMVRKILRQIAMWDRCPMGYRKDIKSQVTEIATIAFVTLGVMILMLAIFIAFC